MYQLVIAALSGGLMVYLIEQVMEWQRRKAMTKKVAEVLLADLFQVVFVLTATPKHDNLSALLRQVAWYQVRGDAM